MRQIVGDEVSTIVDYFQELEDPRSSVNRKHLLGDLIVISVCGVLAGADGPHAIGVWAESNSEWLQQHLELPNGIPSHDTIGRLLATLKPAAFQMSKGRSLPLMLRAAKKRLQRRSSTEVVITYWR